MRKKALLVLLMLFVLSMSSLAFAKVEKGMTGIAVQSVQSMLINAGYLSGSADGDFGSGTEAAVKQFQADHGLEADGIVGDQTQAALAQATGSSDGIGSYSQKLIMDATAYSSQDPGNGPYTAGGNLLTHGYVSVDPNVIPLGTKLYIEGYGYAVADDTGGAIVGNRIDLGMDSHAEANAFGRQEVVVYVLE